MSPSPNPPEITERLVRRLAWERRFSAARSYFRNGAVTNLSRRGDHLIAQVEGSSYEPSGSM